MRQEIAVDRDFTFSVFTSDRTIDVTATSCTVNIYDNENNVIVEDASPTIATGRLSYTFSASDNDETGKNFLIDFEYVIDGTTYNQSMLFDVVKYPIINLVNDDDILKRQNSLIDKISYHGVIESATTATITDSRLKASLLDYKGGLLKILDSNGDYQHKTITAFDSSLGRVTYTPIDTEAYGADLTFTLRASFHEEVKTAVRQKYDIQSNLIDAQKVEELVIIKSLELIYLDYLTDTESDAGVKYELYKKEYTEKLAKFNEAADIDMDGDINDTEDSASRARQNWYDIGR